MATQQSMLLSSKFHDDLSNWEFIHQSDCSSDDDDVKSFDLDESILSLDDSSSTSSVVDDIHDVIVHLDDIHDVIVHLDDIHDVVVDDVHDDVVDDDDDKDDNFDITLSKFVVNNHETMINDNNYVINPNPNPNEVVYHGYVNKHKYFDYDNHVVVNLDDDNNDDEDEDDDDEMDDDLVPWEMKGLYMRQRIRKSGKKSTTKMAKSARKALMSSVRGKYGAGLKGF